MRNEYLAINKAGLVLQIDAPDLAMDRTMMYRDLSDADFVKRCERHVAAINNGIEGIPRDRVRLHICYGNWEGPHIHDVALDIILPALYQAKVGALSIEFSNPRHAHEYAALKRVPLPAKFVMAAGGITYPLYLLHMQLGYVIFTATSPHRHAVIVTGIIIAEAVFLAWIIWRFLEPRTHSLVKIKLTEFADRLGWFSSRTKLTVQ